MTGDNYEANGNGKLISASSLSNYVDKNGEFSSYNSDLDMVHPCIDRQFQLENKSAL